MSRFTLQCFGGAGGGQHACRVADGLGMGRVLLHPFAGVLSAYGMGLADQTVLRQQVLEVKLEAAALPRVAAVADALAEQARGALAEQGTDLAGVRVTRTLHLRYQGTEAALMVGDGELDAVVAGFTAAHRARFGFATPRRAIIVEAVGVEATSPGSTVKEEGVAAREKGAPKTLDRIDMWSGWRAHEAFVFDRAGLRAGDEIEGPALIRETIGTIVIDEGWRATVTALSHIVLERVATLEPGAERAERADPVLLELFNNLFMHVAEQTGLVPVHLGAMGESVKIVLRQRGGGGTLRPGDVVAGEFREAEFRALLGSGRDPARSPDVNVADIKVQVAANEAGCRSCAGSWVITGGRRFGPIWGT